MPPGITILPVASMKRLALLASYVPAAATAAIFSPEIAMSQGATPAGVTTRSLVMIRSNIVNTSSIGSSHPRRRVSTAKQILLGSRLRGNDDYFLQTFAHCQANKLFLAVPSHQRNKLAHALPLFARIDRRFDALAAFRCQHLTGQ